MSRRTNYRYVTPEIHKTVDFSRRKYFMAKARNFLLTLHFLRALCEKDVIIVWKDLACNYPAAGSSSQKYVSFMEDKVLLA